MEQTQRVERAETESARRAAQPAWQELMLGAVAESAPVSALSAPAVPLSTGGVLGLQRATGNRTVSRMIARRVAASSRLIRRHPEGTELPEKAADVAEIEAKAQPAIAEEQALPADTRSPIEAMAQKGEAIQAGAAFQGAPALTRGAMSLASAQKILQGQFGDVATIVGGTIMILADQAACSAKYNEVCIAANLKYKLSLIHI